MTAAVAAGREMMQKGTFDYLQGLLPTSEVRRMFHDGDG